MPPSGLASHEPVRVVVLGVPSLGCLPSSRPALGQRLGVGVRHVPCAGRCASPPASALLGPGLPGFGALGTECGGDVGGEDDALAGLAVDAAFFDLDAAVF